MAILAGVQSLVIVWLASWAVGDYMNNQYVRDYVNGTIQANMLMLWAVIGIVIAGSVGGLFVKRRSHGSLELVNVKGSKDSGKLSTPVVSQKMGGSSGSASTPAPTASAGPSIELHPAVAALKQEMSERRMSLGMNAGMADQGQGPSNSPPKQNTPSSVASMLPPDIRALAQTPKPASQPSGAQQSPPMLHSVQQPPTLSHPPMQTLPVARPPQQATPMIRQGPPSAPLQGPVQPSLPPPRPATVIPQNVTTVITGIMPKKKDPNDPNDEKSSN